MALFFLAALAAFFMLRLAADFCLLLAILASSLEVLHCTLVSFSLLPARESTKIATLAGLGILFSGIQAVLASFEFADHAFWDADTGILVALSIPSFGESD
jgi:hypothetical protein